jgi:DNA-directed RNA polymerase subunit M/transcription elongation factor TFIIS
MKCPDCGETKLLSYKQYGDDEPMYYECLTCNKTYNTEQIIHNFLGSRSNCECYGYGWFYGSEIDGWKGKPHQKLLCRKCYKLSFIRKMYYTYKGYLSNSQIIERK